jgi:hypothetical protein
MAKEVQKPASDPGDDFEIAAAQEPSEAEEKKLFKAALKSRRSAHPIDVICYEEEYARHLVSVFENGARNVLARNKLASKKHRLSDEKEQKVEWILKRLRPSFEGLSKIVKPLKIAYPKRVPDAFKSIRCLMDYCFEIGGIAKISKTDRSLKAAGRKGGNGSAKARIIKSEEKWRALARTLAVKIRTNKRWLTQDQLAEAIVSEAKWGDGGGVEHITIVRFISKLQAAGELAPRLRRTN